MSDEPQIKDIFFEAVRIDGEQSRGLYLDRVCGDNADLRRHVEALLAAHAQPESYLERPAADFQLGVTNGPSPQRQPGSDRVAEQIGSVIGPYKLLEQVGEGGMGVVYMAEQKEPVRRKVALKIIKPGMDTRQVVARFEAERQALAIMDHPNIAHVLDAGSTESGRPYFVMELVRGIPVTQYCDQNKLSTKARLELFVSVCRAVQHAHTKGIIHRDIKPTNVLVTLHDGVPVPKIIDFGVAKAINQDLTEKTLFTAFAQMIGTPLYMSPEQAEMSGLDIDTRSDIYSLGVLLYELLTGVTPFDKKRIQTAAYDEVRRIIREEEPAKPSTRVSSLGDSSSAVCSQRRTDANKLHQQLRGELDWIVMTSLEKDRTRRYQSASEFAEDVGRHLSGETVRACPPTVGYRFRKFARRYKTQVALVSAFLFLLLTSSAVAWILLAQARQATDTARLEQKKTLAAKEDLQTEKSRAEENYRLAEDRRVQLQEKLYDYSWLQATAAYRENDTSRVAESLKDCPEPLRGWEWYYLQRMTAPERTVNMGEHRVVWFDSCPVIPRIAALDNAGNLSVRDLTDGRELWSRKTEMKQPFAVRFSADGNLIGVTSSPFVLPGRVQIWDATTGQMEWSLPSENEAVTMADFSPDGRFLALGTVPIFGTKGHVQLWDLATQEQVWTNSCKGFPAFVFAHDSQRLYLSLMFYGSWERPSTLCCWEVDKPKEVWSVDRNSASLPDLSSDGTKLLLGGLNHSLEVREVASGAVITELEGSRPDTAIYARFSSNDRYIVSRGDSGKVVLWDWESKKEVRSIQTPGHRALGPVAFTTDGRHFAVESTSLTGVQLRATTPLAASLTLAGHEKLVNAVCFSSDATKLLSISVDGSLRTWSTATGQELSARIVHSRAYTVACSPDGNYIATGGGDGVQLWDARTETELLHRWEEAGGVWWIDFSSNGDRVVTGGGKAGIMVWNATDGERIQTFPLTGRRFDGLVFLDDARQVASLMGTSGRLDLWNVDTGASEMLGPETHVPLARGLALNRKHNTLAAGILTQIVLWDLENKQQRAGLTGHDYPVHTVTFSPDGTRLFSGDADGVIKVWNWRTGKELFSMQAHESTGSNWGKVGVRSLAISPDGTTLASAGADGLVKLWKTTRSPDGLATK